MVLSVLKAEKQTPLVTQGDTEHLPNTPSHSPQVSVSSTSCFKTGGKSWLHIFIFLFMLDLSKNSPLLLANFPFLAASSSQSYPATVKDDLGMEFGYQVNIPNRLSQIS